jgi:glycosyltransferase involved in cell wall biosynthesis
VDGAVAGAPSPTEADEDAPSQLRVAIVHEWLTGIAGSEKCVLEMCRAFPASTVYTSVHSVQAVPELAGAVRTSLVQRWPGATRSHVRALPVMPLAMRALRLADEHDLLIRSFHTFAMLPPNRAGLPELVYCYTPPRFLHRSTTLQGERAWVRAGMVAARPMRSLDRRLVRQADLVVGISTAVSARIEATYDRPAPVLHPPVDVAAFGAARRDERDDHFVFCSRLVPYKRPDLAIEAFRGLPHRLVVVGDGRMRDELAADLPPNVELVGRLADAELQKLLGTARGFVFPAEEDFGIAPVEAMAAGAPVIAFGRGGALDYVRPGENGVLVDRQEPAAFARAVREVAATDWAPDVVAASVQEFAPERFRRELRLLVDGLLAVPGTGR